MFIMLRFSCTVQVQMFVVVLSSEQDPWVQKVLQTLSNNRNANKNSSTCSLQRRWHYPFLFQSMLHTGNTKQAFLVTKLSALPLTVTGDFCGQENLYEY